LPRVSGSQPRLCSLAGARLAPGAFRNEPVSAPQFGMLCQRGGPFSLKIARA
jgi:hypothetical protein